MRGEVVQDLHVDVHAHPGGDDDEQGVGGHESGVGAAEGGGADVRQRAHLVGVGGLHAEQLHVRAVDDGEDRARHRHARRTIVARLLPCGAVAADLIRLDFAQGLGGGLGDQGGGHQVEPVLGGLLGRSVGAGAVENVLTQLGHHGEDRQGGGGLEHVGVLPVQRCGGGESVAVHCSHERLEVGSCHVRAVGRVALVAEGLPAAVSHLWGAT